MKFTYPTKFNTKKGRNKTSSSFILVDSAKDADLKPSPITDEAKSNSKVRNRKSCKKRNKKLQNQLPLASKVLKGTKKLNDNIYQCKGEPS